MHLYLYKISSDIKVILTESTYKIYIKIISQFLIFRQNVLEFISHIVSPMTYRMKIYSLYVKLRKKCYTKFGYKHIVIQYSDKKNVE